MHIQNILDKYHISKRQRLNIFEEYLTNCTQDNFRKDSSIKSSGVQVQSIKT